MTDRSPETSGPDNDSKPILDYSHGAGENYKDPDLLPLVADLTVLAIGLCAAAIALLFTSELEQTGTPGYGYYALIFFLGPLLLLLFAIPTHVASIIPMISISTALLYATYTMIVLLSRRSHRSIIYILALHVLVPVCVLIVWRRYFLR